MSQHTLKSAIGTALAVSLAGATTTAAAASPFTLTEGQAHPLQLAEGKCGEGKCGAGKAAGETAGKDGGHRSGRPQVSEMADRDGDGVVSREEYFEWAREQARRQFNELDVNDDGKVDRAERETYYKP